MTQIASRKMIDCIAKDDSFTGRQSILFLKCLAVGIIFRIFAPTIPACQCKNSADVGVITFTVIHKRTANNLCDLNRLAGFAFPCRRRFSILAAVDSSTCGPAQQKFSWRVFRKC